MHFKVSTVLPMPAAEFFLERDSAAFRSLVARSANLGGLDIVEGWLEGETEVYRFVTKPDLDKFVPKRLQKHFKEGGLQYTDIIRYDPAKISQPPFVLDVTSIPPILAERSQIDCTLTIADEEPGNTCRQTLEGHVAFRLMVLGSLAERIVVDSLHKVYLGIPAIVQRWVEFREEVLRLENGREVLLSGRVDNASVPWITDSIRGVTEAPLTQVPKDAATEDSGFANCLANGEAGKAVEAIQAENGNTPKMTVVVPEERLQEKQKSPTQQAGRERENGSVGQARHGEPPAAERQQARQVIDGGVERAQQPTSESSAGADGWSEGSSDASAAAPEGAAHPQNVDGQTFFDAQEEWDWREEEAAWQDYPAMEDELEADHAAAMEWFRQARERGENVSGITLQHTPFAASRGRQHRTAIGRRFSAGYSKSHAFWDKFWAEHKVPRGGGVDILAATAKAISSVPRVAGVDSLAARLGHLLCVASRTGAIRLRRSRKSSDGGSRSASSDASSLRLQADEGPGHTGSPHAQFSQGQHACQQSGGRHGATEAQDTHRQGHQQAAAFI